MVSRKRAETDELTKAELQELSDFRYQLRRFLRFSEEIVHAEGITPLQYMLLLHIGGFPERDWATVGELAERLQASSHGTVALVSRCEAAGLVVRRSSAEDRRQVEVHLLKKGERCLARLALLHKTEVQSVGWAFKTGPENP
ncbi:helix-turn-helix domain-containing protein [Paraburkholderia sp. BL9I2N2]|uniref:MarR family winged helix-turn-helix transcriptional regulator n=1 Tax=Paraburkholderia sp. BL9I2N2 TaxID=1938809 RepID=UPI00104F6CD2|nr:helix-turn-helix domain-containing protein [Paraburkholderia sp. BL9I2N2]TCK84198.1 MarR family transcriptional regulator [Paraburkholderia sp. BL9I2N2]